MTRTILRVNWLRLKRDVVALVLTFVLPLVFFSIFATIFGDCHGDFKSCEKTSWVDTGCAPLLEWFQNRS